MKQIRKIILSASMLLTFSIAAFAESGFEAILNVPFGASIGIPPKSMKDYFGTSEAGAGFDSGVSAQLGYMIQAGDTTAVSILAEVGYAYDTVSSGKSDLITVEKVRISVKVIDVETSFVLASGVGQGKLKDDPSKITKKIVKDLEKQLKKKK